MRGIFRGYDQKHRGMAKPGHKCQASGEARIGGNSFIEHVRSLTAFNLKAILWGQCSYHFHFIDVKTRTHRREMIKLWCFKPLFYLFIYLYFLAAPQGMRDPSSPSIEPVPPAVEARSPSHWTTREFPMFSYFKSSTIIICKWLHIC